MYPGLDLYYVLSQDLGALKPLDQGWFQLDINQVEWHQSSDIRYLTARIFHAAKYRFLGDILDSLC